MGVRLERVTNLKYCTFLPNIIYSIYHRFWLSVPPLNPHNRYMVTIFGGRCRQYPIDGVLILDLHNSSHHIYSASFNVWNICDSIRFSIEEENFELVSAMLRRGVEKSSHWSRANHYIIHDIFTIITFNPENWFLLFCRQLRKRSTLTVETQLLSNEKFGNRSSENVSLNLNLLVSIFLTLLISAVSFSILCLDFIFIHSQ